MKTDNRIKVVIPALNEESAIGLVVRAIPDDLVEEVIVVDNGSTDATEKRAREAGATVLTEPGRGYGWACMRGIRHLEADPPVCVVFMDGDYSDHPDELPALAEPILRDQADFVIGSRVRGTSEPGALAPQARLGNRFACAILYRKYGVRYTDLGPFRAIRFRDLVEMDMQEMTYGWTVEMQIKAAQRGLRCLEVPVSYRNRIGKSKVTGTVSGTLKASARILWVLARSLAVRR